MIWAIGSSWTHSQGDGYGLMLAIRERFPAAPQIIYRRHHGSGTPWDFDWGWVKQFVAADQPVAFSTALVENLPNREHTLELVTVGDGHVTIDGFYVFQPLEKD